MVDNTLVLKTGSHLMPLDAKESLGSPIEAVESRKALAENDGGGSDLNSVALAKMTVAAWPTITCDAQRKKVKRQQMYTGVYEKTHQRAALFLYWIIRKNESV